ncbi:DUF4148 domain-containing protein [Pseudoduganella aquatica]|uniref:DUF4148 domain-containing protein n=1 Tax=Pseudoduganella aquatica TaxID=2660641 RepID=A0A7X4KPB7_9BURK|nr:DUF4148 domain-containing protein [Pseudoduganella aquatica]MYN10047.1 DUF4148 domain-containing protein [Pseudoduganella aquatica]
MNAKQLIASVSLLLAAGAAFAEPAELNFPKLNAAQKTELSREAVKAEVIRARNAGELELTEVTYPPLVNTSSTLTREQVKADVLAARANGELDLNEVNYPSFFDGRVQRPAQTLTASAKRSAAAQ